MNGDRVVEALLTAISNDSERFPINICWKIVTFHVSTVKLVAAYSLCKMNLLYKEEVLSSVTKFMTEYGGWNGFLGDHGSKKVDISKALNAIAQNLPV